MALRKRIIIQKEHGIEREGRGFSRKELEKAGISLKKALRQGLPIDARRRTLHDKNIKLLKQQLKKYKTSRKPVSKANKKRS